MSMIHGNPISEICKIGFRVSVRPKKIRKDGRVTVVFWSDGTSTAVRRSDDDADNLYNAFCAALGKKVFGNNTALKREIDNCPVEVVMPPEKIEQAEIPDTPVYGKCYTFTVPSVDVKDFD